MATASPPQAETTQDAATPETAAPAGRATSLPRGPRAHPLAQTLAWALVPTWVMDRCARTIGES
ncbi:MAG TPA: hypothetical protein VF706_03530, partial [Solirubrobacteraceae bacterium]